MVLRLHYQNALDYLGHNHIPTIMVHHISDAILISISIPASLLGIAINGIANGLFQF